MSSQPPLRLGSFELPCFLSSTIPPCALFVSDVVVATRCPPTRIKIGTVSIRDLPDILICGCAAILTLLMTVKCVRKSSGVGNREMILLLIWYLCLLAFQLTNGFLDPNSWESTYVSAVHIGFIIGTSWVLLLNGVVGYQIVDDGSPFSVMTIGASGVLVTIGVAYIALLVRLKKPNPMPFDEPSKFSAPILFAIYFLGPLIAASGYAMLQTTLVVRQLGERKPLLWLCGALVAAALGQVFQFAIGPLICEGTSGYLDGQAPNTFCIGVAIFAVFKFWDTITEDEWDIHAI